MDLLVKTKELCRLYKIKPSRSKGQNFLIDETIYEAVIRAADLKKTDQVLEVGPGLGFLTARLAQAAGQVAAVELDDQLAAFLQTGLKAQAVDNITIINQDVLKLTWSDLPFEAKADHPGSIGQARPYKVVANLPYNISSFFLRQFLSAEWRPELLVLLLQKEVAERIVAQPGEMSLLAVSVQYYAQAEIIQTVPAAAFWPAPQVESAIIRIKPYPSGPAFPNPEQEARFFRLVRIGFSAKRKMLKNNLAAGLDLKSAGLGEALAYKGFDPKIRAEDLSLADWRQLFAALGSFML